MLSQVGAAAGLVVVAVVLAQSPIMQAQAGVPPVGAVVRVANTDGQPLNLRAGSSSEQAVVMRLPVGALLTVTGPAQTTGATRWLPVRTDDGTNGWVAAQYVAVVSTPTPLPSPTRDPARAATPSLTPESAPAAPSGGQSSATSDANQQVRPVDVDARLKYPEVRGRDQEITVWVSRAGEPIAGAAVTVVSKSGEDDEPVRELDPTDADGKTRREFDIRHEKGAVELHVEAVAPDGGAGSTVVTYFRR
jgi:uncharacterized protein YraI